MRLPRGSKRRTNINITQIMYVEMEDVTSNLTKDNTYCNADINEVLSITDVQDAHTHTRTHARTHARTPARTLYRLTGVKDDVA